MAIGGEPTGAQLTVQHKVDVSFGPWIAVAEAVLFVVVLWGYATHAVSPTFSGVSCGLAVVFAWAFAIRIVPIPSVYHLFLAAFSLLFLVQPILAPFIDVAAPSSDVARTYLLLTVGGLILFNASYRWAMRSAPEVGDSGPNMARVNRTFWLLVSLYGVALALIVIDAGSIPAVVMASRADRIQGRSFTTILAIYLVTFSAGAFVLLPSQLRRGGVRLVAIVCALGAAEVFLFLAFRLRTFLLMHSIAVGVGFLYLWPYWYGDSRVRRRSRKRSVVVGIVSLSALIVVAPYVRFARGLFETQGAAGLARVDLAAAIRLSFTAGDFGYSPVVYEVIRLVPRYEPHLRGQSYYRLLFAPIPRRLMPSKPPNTERLVASWIAPGVAELTVPPGVQGDLYINFGVLGVLGFLLWGGLFGLIDRLPTATRLLVVGGSATVVFHFVRGGFTNSVLLFSTLLLLSLVARRLIGFEISGVDRRRGARVDDPGARTLES